MSKIITFQFLGTIFLSFIFSASVVAYDMSQEMDGTGNASVEGESDIESSDSMTGDQKAREWLYKRKKTLGSISLNPQDHDGMHDVTVGLKQPVYVQEFIDKSDARSNRYIIGEFYPGLNQSMVDLMNKEPLGIAIKNVMEQLFSANGFTIEKILNKKNNPLIVKGEINKIWVDIIHTIRADVNINARVINSENSQILWSGKIAKKRDVPLNGFNPTTAPTVVEAANLATWGDQNTLCPFLNYVLADALSEAWNKGGLRKEVKIFAERNKGKRDKTIALKQIAHSEPDTKNAKANLKLGAQYCDLGKPEKAIKYLLRASQLEPKWARARYQLGVAYLKAGKKDLAVDQYEILKKLDENYAKRLFAEIYGD